MKNAPGRPFKYLHVIELLDPNELYAACSIADKAGFVGDETIVKARRTRVRVSMNRFIRFNDFSEGTLISIKGQRPITAWKGSYWQKKFGVKHKKARKLEFRVDALCLKDNRYYTGLQIRTLMGGNDRVKRLVSSWMNQLDGKSPWKGCVWNKVIDQYLASTKTR